MTIKQRQRPSYHMLHVALTVGSCLAVVSGARLLAYQEASASAPTAPPKIIHVAPLAPPSGLSEYPLDAGFTVELHAIPTVMVPLPVRPVARTRSSR